MTDELAKAYEEQMKQNDKWQQKQREGRMKITITQRAATPTFLSYDEVRKNSEIYQYLDRFDRIVKHFYFISSNNSLFMISQDSGLTKCYDNIWKDVKFVKSSVTIQIGV